MRIIYDIAKQNGKTNPSTILDIADAFEELLQNGFIEQFVNDKNEVDYRLTGRPGTMQILQDKEYDFMWDK